jgi:hypothetical protein
MIIRAILGTLPILHSTAHWVITNLLPRLTY